jgi:hypothetical protein
MTLRGYAIIFFISFFWFMIEALRYYFIKLDESEAEVKRMKKEMVSDGKDK